MDIFSIKSGPRKILEFINDYQTSGPNLSVIECAVAQTLHQNIGNIVAFVTKNLIFWLNMKCRAANMTFSETVTL